MDINSFFVGTGAKTFERHPLGEFDAFVRDVAMVRNDGKKPFVKVSLETQAGSAPDFRYFPVTPDDAHAAQHSPEARKKLVSKVEFNKGLFVRLGMVSEFEVQGWTQDKLLGAYASLKGRSVRIKVEDDPYNPQYSKTSILGSAAAPSASAPSHQPDQFGMPLVPPSPPSAPSSQPSFGLPNQRFDDIPF